MPISALYIHIPFCNSLCTYCDFYKMLRKDSIKEEYIDYILKELELKKVYLKNLKTIYIGGGTPSSLPLKLLEELLIALKKAINLDNIEEFTIEANPLDINDSFVDLLTKYKVNRLSLGVQSFNTKKLIFLGRRHRKKDVFQAIKTLKNHGLSNINIDLIYGTPNENRLSFFKDLRKAIRLKVNHISTYALILEEHTILYNQYINKSFKEMDDDLEASIYYKMVKYLKRHHFEHYEISNFAKHGYESKHNLVYWNNEHYLGLGASASYYIANTRYTNIPNLKKYYQGINDNNLIYSEEISLTKLEQMKEEMILGLRKVDGISINHFQEKFNCDIHSIFPKEISKLLSLGLLENVNNNLKIPENKLFLSNRACEEFV